MAGTVHSEDGDSGFQIAPMVDVVFVLLLFFMASAGSQILEQELKVDLPGKPQADNLSNVTVYQIDISAEGQVALNGQQMGAPGDGDLLALKEKLKTLVTDFGGRDPVLIRPSPETRHGRIVDVLDACSWAKVTKLSFG